MKTNRIRWYIGAVVASVILATVWIAAYLDAAGFGPRGRR